MGYYTSYEVEIVKGDKSLIPALREFSENAAYAIDDDGSTEERCKWYNSTKELKAFSLLHPDALIKLSGEGEENADIWVEYFQNGKSQECKAIITFDEFDESKLK